MQAINSQGRTPAQLAEASGNGVLADHLLQEAQRLGQAEEVDAIVKNVSPANSGEAQGLSRQHHQCPLCLLVYVVRAGSDIQQDGSCFVKGNVNCCEVPAASCGAHLCRRA